MFSVVCIGLFVAGLVVFLQKGSAPAAPAGGGSAQGSAGSAAGSADAGSAGSGSAAPAIPAGMLLVKRADGTPWFYVDARPVSLAAFRSVFADHKQAGGIEEPVVSLKYDEARSYARTKGGRLLRSDEWDAARDTPGFQDSPALLEWVESPEGKRTVRQKDKTETRADKEYKDVTFRMAKDI
jgi:hypothetical protein